MAIGREILVLGISYGLGCLCTGYYLARARTGQDIRLRGSGSAGATNVGRLLGRSGFFLTLGGDVAKGLLALCLTRALTPAPWALPAAFCMVVCGHIWPAQMGFRGGKGVATAFGALLGYDGRLALETLAVFGLILLFTRKRTPSALAAILACPLIAWGRHFVSGQQMGLWCVVVVLALAHRDNLRALFASSRRASATSPQEEGEP